MLDSDLCKRYAMRFVGLPYVWGGDDPIIGFDCSGLAQELLAAMGVAFATDQTAQGLFNQNWPVSLPRLGALAFYGESKSQISHVGFCLNESTMIEAGGGGSKTLSSADAARQNAYIRLRPINRRKDLVAVRMPNYP